MKIKLFTKDGCPNCPKVKKFLEEYSSENKDVKIEYYDTETTDGLAESAYYNVFSVPTAIIFKGDTEIKRILGNVDKENLK